MLPAFAPVFLAFLPVSVEAVSAPATSQSVGPVPSHLQGFTTSVVLVVSCQLAAQFVCFPNELNFSKEMSAFSMFSSFTC